MLSPFGGDRPSCHTRTLDGVKKLDVKSNLDNVNIKSMLLRSLLPLKASKSTDFDTPRH